MNPGARENAKLAITLSMDAVNLNTRAIMQWPSLGVHTKFTKKATTYLLDIPDLMPIVRDWDNLVQEKMPENAYWFTALPPETGNFDESINEVGQHRSSRATKDLKDWLCRVGLPYHSPHKFRHGHAVYSLELSKDVADLKAVSMNLMHSNISITGGVYGILSAADVGRRIAGLGEKLATRDNSHDIASQLIALAEMLKNSSALSGIK
jgi:integrase